MFCNYIAGAQQESGQAVPSNVGLLPNASKAYYSVDPNIVQTIPTTRGTYMMMIQDRRGTGRHALVYFTHYTGDSLYMNTIFKAGALTISASGTSVEVSSNGYIGVWLWKLAT